MKDATKNVIVKSRI